MDRTNKGKEGLVRKMYEYVPNDLSLVLVSIFLGVVFAEIRPLGKTLRSVNVQALSTFVPYFKKVILVPAPVMISLFLCEEIMAYPFKLNHPDSSQIDWTFTGATAGDSLMSQIKTISNQIIVQ